MVEYGYIDDGYLRSRILEPRTESYKDGDEIKSRVISIPEQIKMLGDLWKPVDLIDDTKMRCRDGYVIRLVPYDAGDHISYEYKEVFDTQKVKKEIAVQKEFLSGSDYKITKCNEAMLMGEPLPYDIQFIHIERQQMRDTINELEALLKIKYAKIYAY
ncbi:MAG: hypothetical protein RSF01_07245 [Bacteroidales bacterium]